MIRIMLSLLIVLAAASSTFAEDRPRTFSNSDIKGHYGLLAQGSSVVPGTPIAFPAVYVGKVVSDGNGNLQGMGTINPGGPISGLQPGQPVTLTGTYAVDTDGTGDFTGTGSGNTPSATSNSNDPPSVLGAGALVIESFNQIELVSTEPNRVFYTTLKKQRPPSGAFSNATLRGAWGFACHGSLVTSTGDPSTATESSVAVVGLMTNDGHGKFSAEDTANTNGVVSQESFVGVNSVASDGTISATATGAKPLLASLVGIFDDSREFRMISTDAGTVVGCAFTAQGRRGDSRD
jgi:hypothetical protein